MTLGFLGTDYQRAPLGILEKFHFGQEAIAQFKSDFNSQAWITEYILLSTCNRVELYFLSDDVPKATEWLISYFAQQRHLTTDELTALHGLSGENAMLHLFRVVAGVESMVFGENEILSQAKNALTQAQELSTSSAFLNKLFQVAITSGKRIRKETQISRGSYSISSIAVDCIRERFANFLLCKILVIGAGTIGLRAIKKLHALNHPDVSITNRTEDKLMRLCAHYDLGLVPFKSLPNALLDFDVILVATSSESYILTPENVKSPKPQTLMIDLSVPRNIDPILGDHPDITLVAIDGLKEIADHNVANRKKEMSKIQVILEDEMDQFNKWIMFKDQL